LNCGKKKKRTAEEFTKEKEKKRGLKEANEKSNFKNPEGTVLRRRRVFYNMEVTLDDSKKFM
jgi:hypothetical protein